MIQSRSPLCRQSFANRKQDKTLLLQFGAGKSTFVQLLMKFYEPNEGTFYIIVRGKVEVWKQSVPSHEVSRVAILEDGDHFGEIALMMPIPRTATIRALTPCTLLSMRRHSFHGRNRLKGKVSANLS